MIKDSGTLNLSSHLQNHFSANLANSRLAVNAFSTQQRASRRGATSRAIADLAGNTKATATVLTTPGSQTFREFVSRRDSDFYRFTLDTASTVKISFLNQSKDSIFRAVFNGDGSVLTSKRQKQAGNIQSRQESIAVYRAIRPGTYYLQIKGGSASSSKYKLSISTTLAETDCGCGG
jgi:Bacterial pre-peptidase C-terminal domain